jgi:hypothetical protein
MPDKISAGDHAQDALSMNIRWRLESKTVRVIVLHLTARACLKDGSAGVYVE